MPEIIDSARFVHVYRQSVRDVTRFVTRERQMLISRHDLSLHPDRHDLGAYLAASERRYLELVRLYNRHGRVPTTEIRALDVGGFLGAYPLTLARMNLLVTLAEQYDYYYGAFDELVAFLDNEGVAVWDADFTEPLDDINDRFTLISNMAMIEHLADSPKTLMENLRLCIDQHGLLIIDLPNVAYWPNRLKAIRGESIHQPLAEVYSSVSPYLGHHREYTVCEVRDLLAWSRFANLDIKCFNYSFHLHAASRLGRLYTVLHIWPMLIFPSCREIIMAAAKPTDE
jgi:SAM-dependent methyltransferase